MGYFDLQVNGYAGVDFNGDDVSESAVSDACERLREDGVDGILATIITDWPEMMVQRLARLAAACRNLPRVAEIIRGIHIEGPFLNEQPGYIGAHPPLAAREADIDLMNRFLDAADGLTRIVTLAPERDPGLRVTRMLSEQGICVSAGHCNPTLDQLKAAIDAGITMFTHLGNGCPLELNRHDNIIQRVLSLADRLWIGFIADGVHVPFPAMGNYLKCAGFQRALVVTDAIAAAGMGPGTFTIGQQTVLVDEDLATWAPDRSHLMGSAGTMPRTAENLRRHLQLTREEIESLTSRNPRRAIGIDRA
jgi:N-acetylglucosamine-6-phosphate deacetylase